MIKNRLSQFALILALWAGSAAISEALTTSWSGISTADTFVTTGTDGSNSGNNYGAAGALEIAPAGAAKGEFQTLVKFNLAAAKAQFDIAYGIGDWQITNIQITLASNMGVQGTQPMNAIFNLVNGGGFSVDWLSNDNWVEGGGTPMMNDTTSGGATYNSLGTLLASTHETVGAFTYVAPGNNIGLTYTLNLTSDLVNDATAAGDLSLLFYASAGSQVGYLFNSHSFPTNQPTITITAIPEPAALSLLAGGIAALALRRLIGRTSLAK